MVSELLKVFRVFVIASTTTALTDREIIEKFHTGMKEDACKFVEDGSPFGFYQDPEEIFQRGLLFEQNQLIRRTGPSFNSISPSEDLNSFQQIPSSFPPIDNSAEFNALGERTTGGQVSNSGRGGRGGRFGGYSGRSGGYAGRSGGRGPYSGGRSSYTGYRQDSGYGVQRRQSSFRDSSSGPYSSERRSVKIPRFVWKARQDAGVCSFCCNNHAWQDCLHHLRYNQVDQDALIEKGF